MENKRRRTVPVTEKNFEKRLSSVYYSNVVRMLEEALNQLSSIQNDPNMPPIARIKAAELVLQASRIIKAKESIVQVNTQINNRSPRGDDAPTGGGVRSFESILRRLEARDEVIDVRQ